MNLIKRLMTQLNNNIMKYIRVAILSFIVASFGVGCSSQEKLRSVSKIISDNKTKEIKVIPLDDLYINWLNKKYKGKKILVVNVASECGYTPQYKELEWLYKNYKDSGLVILGFPCNDFGDQEPKGEKDIKAFCEKNYGATFPMMSKISVKGSDMHPIYEFLTQKKLNGLENSSVEWNFQKYLIGNTGKLEKVINPRITPMDETIQEWIRG